MGLLLGAAVAVGMLFLDNGSVGTVLERPTGVGSVAENVVPGESATRRATTFPPRLNDAPAAETSVRDTNPTGRPEPAAVVDGADIADGEAPGSHNDEILERELRKLSDAQVLARLRDLPRDRSHLNRLDPRLDFTGMDLHGADLQAVDLSFADLKRSDLTGANLAHADLRHALLEDAALADAALPGADIRGAAMYETNLKGADLRNANAALLRIAEGQYASALFFGADLRNADLRGADLRGALLPNADLRGTDLRGTDLQATVLRGAMYDLRTRFPSGFDPSASNMVFKEP